MTGAPAQVLAVAFAIAGAFSYAVASVGQQRAASQLPSSAAFDPAVLFRLARRRRWLISLIAVLGGYGFQAAALGFGRLIVVEPVFPIGLLFALLLAARAEGRRLRHAEWTAAVAAVGGLAIFLVAAQPSGGRRTAPAGSLGLAAAGAVAVAVVCCLLAIKAKPAHRALVISVGGGIRMALKPNIFLRVEFRDYLTPFPGHVIAAAPGVHISGWVHDFVPLVGISYLFGK